MCYKPFIQTWELCVLVPQAKMLSTGGFLKIVSFGVVGRFILQHKNPMHTLWDSTVHSLDWDLNIRPRWSSLSEAATETQSQWGSYSSLNEAATFNQPKWGSLTEAATVRQPQWAISLRLTQWCSLIDVPFSRFLTSLRSVINGFGSSILQ